MTSGIWGEIAGTVSKGVEAAQDVAGKVAQVAEQTVATHPYMPIQGAVNPAQHAGYQAVQPGQGQADFTPQSLSLDKVPNEYDQRVAGRHNR